MDKIHVIIPVYNAYEDLKRCIKSLEKYTDLKKHELIFINDNSPDKNIIPLLDNLKQENIKVLHNKENRGFSATINRGIESCEGDVILLNSDTIVTKNWIEKIVACAYSDSAIGTVTPLSNNATLCSVPNFCEENEIPYGYTIDEFANLIETWSIRKYPTITVAHGFCMFIKREVINCIGLFDAETFKRGYGEENDFCFRAEQVGYRNVMCDDTFIYHSGTASFLSEEKKKYIENNNKILESRYKVQWRNNQVYCSMERDKDIRDVIRNALKFNNGKMNILYLVQADFAKDASNNIGGTQFHVKDLTLDLKDKYNIFVAARDNEYLRVTVYIGQEKFLYKFFIGKEPEYFIFKDGLQKDIYNNILQAFSIDIVHIHHTFKLSLELYYEAKKLNIPIITSIHDYYYVCPTLKLLNHDKELCIGKEDTEMCSVCLNNRFGFSKNINFIKEWRAKTLEVLELCDYIITPSNNARKNFSFYYPQLDNKILVVEHGMDYEEIINDYEENNNIITDKCKYYFEEIFDGDVDDNLINGWAYLEDYESKDSKVFLHISDQYGDERFLKTNMTLRGDVVKSTNNDKYLYSGFSISMPTDIFKNGDLKIKLIISNSGKYMSDGQIRTIEYSRHREKQDLHIAFVGAMAYEKGSELAYNMIKNSDKNIKWHIFGGITDSKLDELNEKNLVKTGWYKRNELSSLIKFYKIDIVCILPIIPETFCYTLSEVLLCKVPVIATAIGALGDRVKEMNCGWTIPVNDDYKEILKLIINIKSNPDELNEKLDTVNKLRIKNIKEMVADYADIYEKYKKKVYGNVKFDSHLMYSGYLLGNRGLFDRNNNCQEILDRIEQLKNEINSIYSSVGYKILVHIKMLNIPFKSQIKHLIIKCFRIVKRIKNKG